MYDQTVSPVPQQCSFCGTQAVQPRVDETRDRFTGEIVVEATWCCPSCGNRFAQGIIERRQGEKS